MVAAIDSGTIESIRDAVQCWILDERRCVTARRISLEFGTTRKQATEVLESIIASAAGQGGDDDDSDAAVDERHGYEVTRCLVVVNKGEEKGHDRKMTVVKLETNIVSSGSTEEAARKDEGSIYSVSVLTGPPPKPGGAGPPLSNCRVHAAHESDRVRERDTLRGNDQEDASGPQGVGAIRPPSPLVGALAANSGGAARVYDTRVTGAYSTAPGSRACTSSRGALAAAKRKKTTAADFFGPSSSSDTTKEKGSGGGKSSKSKKGEPPTAAAKQAKDKKRRMQHKETNDVKVDADSLPSSAQQQQGGNPEKRRGSRPGGKEDVNARAMSVGVVKGASSEGSAIGDKNGAKNEIIGNADDFVGDVEEDDSSDEEEKMDNPKSRPSAKKNRQGSVSESESASSDRDDISSKTGSKKKNAEGVRSQANTEGRKKGGDSTRQKRQKKTTSRSQLSDHGDSEGEEETKPEPTVGAMDSFVAHEAKSSGNGDDSLNVNGRQQQQQPDGKRRRRQRKTFQERTTMDEHGYMHTETVCVMEDIPSDEEEDENEMNGVKRGSGASAYANGAKKVKKGVAPTVAKNANGKKQAGLMGFFAVKKKK